MRCPRSCGHEQVRWLVLAVDGRRGKHAVTFACKHCHRQRLSLADVEDLEAAIQHVAGRYLKEHHVTTRPSESVTDSVGVDRDEFIGFLTAEAWGLWLRWQPDKGVPFSAYLFRFLPLRANEFFRSTLGRSGNKLQPALSGLRPDDRLGPDHATQQRDPALPRDPDLLRLVGGCGRRGDQRQRRADAHPRRHLDRHPCPRPPTDGGVAT